jgi:hypothetical protein
MTGRVRRAGLAAVAVQLRPRMEGGMGPRAPILCGGDIYLTPLSSAPDKFSSVQGSDTGFYLCKAVGADGVIERWVAGVFVDGAVSGD